MEYGVIGSSGTDDDNPLPQHTRVPVRGRVAVNGRSFFGSASYQRLQIDMEFEIHNLEQIAYGAVLRAFKAQSDALTWEKESLITELRKELRVSDDEHRELLTEVNADDLIHSIREWRGAGGSRNVTLIPPQHLNSQLPSPTVSASRRKQKAFLPSQPLHPLSSGPTPQPLSSAGKWGPTSGIGGRRPHDGQPGFTGQKPMQYQYMDHASGAPTGDPSDGIQDPFISRRVMIRWPADNNFYEAVITDYNPVDGRHSLVYDHGTPNATLEWVNMKEVPPEDIRWVGDNPLTSQLGEPGVPNHNPGRGGASSINQFGYEIQASGNAVIKEDLGEIEIYHTDTLIKKVEKVLDASHPDILEIDKAKKLLQEHEQSLIQVIAKLAKACDNRDDAGRNLDGQITHGQENLEGQ